MSVYSTLDTEIARQLSDQDWVLDPFSAQRNPIDDAHNADNVGRRVWIKRYGTRWQTLYKVSTDAEDRFAMRPSWTEDLLSEDNQHCSNETLAPSDKPLPSARKTTIHV